MRKRIISLILVLSMILTSALYLVACDNSGDNKDGGKTPSKETEKVTEGDKETGGDVESDPVSDKESDPETDPEDTDPADTEPRETDPVTEPDDTDPEETGCEHPYAALPEGHWKPACSVCGKGEGKMQSHEFEEKVEDEGDLLLYSFRCSVCKYRAYKQQVPYEINLFFSAGELATRVDVAGGYTQSFGFDSGVGFGSYSKEGSGTATISVMTGGDANVPTGKYLVMKVRLPRSQSSFSATIKSVHAANALPLSFMGLPSGWVTVVVDLTKAYSSTTTTDAETGEPITTYSGYAPDAVGDFYLGDLKVTAKTVGDESFNFAYALLCDNLDDAKSFIENEKVVVTYDDILNGGGVTDKKECVDENGNPIEHKYIINDDGTHTLLETCYQCGLAAVENEPHVYMQTEIDGELTYACAACKKSQFGANINKYFNAVEMNTTASTYFRIIRNQNDGIGIDEEGNFEFMSFSSTGQTAQILFARNTRDSSEGERAAAFDVGAANYFIIKLRTNTLEQSFGINFATTGAELYEAEWKGVVGMYHTSATLNFPTAVGGADEWVTYVVDLEKVIPKAYAPDENGNIKLVNFYFNVGNANFSSEHIFDVAYMAFVDSWDEVDVLVDDEKVVNVSASNAGSWVMTADRSCVGKHSNTVVECEGGYRIECGSCGAVDGFYDIQDVNVFLPAETLINRTANKTGTFDLELLKDDDGTSFVRLDNFAVNSTGWGGWNLYSSSSLGVTGRYMAIKIRNGENGLGQTGLHLYINSAKSNSSGYDWTKGGFMVKLGEDNEWHTVVVDLGARIPNAFMAEDDGTYKLNFLQIRPFTNKQTLAQPDDYMDIAYIAFFDELSDIPGAVDGEKYEWSTDSTTSSDRYTDTGACITHTVTERVEGTKHTVTCSACGNSLKTFEVEEDINWYSPLGAMDKMGNSLATFQYDGEANVLYNRYFGNGGCHLNVAGGANAGVYTSESFETGSYIVIKYRLSGTVSFEIATGDHGDHATLNPKRPNYSGMGTRTVLGGLSDWEVVLMPIPDGSEEAPFHYTKNSTQPLGIRFTSSSSEYIFDVAYVAVVDSPEEAAMLLDEGEEYTLLEGENPWNGTMGEAPEP